MKEYFVMLLENNDIGTTKCIVIFIRFALSLSNLLWFNIEN